PLKIKSCSLSGASCATKETEPQQQSIDAERIQPESRDGTACVLRGGGLQQRRIRRRDRHRGWWPRIVAAGQCRAPTQQEGAPEGDEAWHPCRCRLLSELRL